MTVALWLLAVQGVIGAFDSLICGLAVDSDTSQDI